MSISLALYKGRGNWVNSLIRWKTDSIYSHCEIVVDGWMYSSTVRDGGVRCKIDSTDAEHWDLIPILFNNGESVHKHYSDTKDNPYGWIDMIQSQIFKRKTADNKGDFCSEWCAAALGLPSPQQYSPDELGELVKWANKNIKM